MHILQERLAFLEERFQALSEEASLPSSAPPPASAPSAPQVEPSITNPSHTQAATTEPTPSPFDTMAISLSRVSYDLTDVKWYEAETLAAPQRNFMYHVHCGAARLALSCGLHRLESQVLRDDSSGRLPSTGPPGVVLLNPPQNQIELADRITTFWMIYLCDKMASVCAGFVGALPDEGSTVDAIRTVFPRRIAEYEADAVTESYNGTLHDLFNATAVPAPELLPDLPWTATLKGLSLLDRATRLGATLQLEPTEETVLAIRRLEFATLGQRSTLPAFDSFVTPTSSALSMSYHDLGMFIGHTSSLGALLEIYQTLVDIDENAYVARLKCAVDIAKLARVAKDGGLVNGCLISAGYCWSLAARVLVQHIESNYATEPYTINYEFKPGIGARDI
ncbi:hypothetical protein FRB90_011879 [Tulasnella sp. 427]|nr:hypothetical protein FRB90_011879 [Tulasnella sp. 427]